jgi:hypothetical protein
MKFSIRDLFWLTVVVALAVGWGVDRSKITAKVDSLEKRLDALQKEATQPRPPTTEDFLRAMRGRNYKKMADESREKYGVP